MELVEKVHIVSGYIFPQCDYQLESERSFMVNKHVLKVCRSCVCSTECGK